MTVQFGKAHRARGLLHTAGPAMPTLDSRSKRTTLILAPIQECKKCSTRIDVSRFEAYQELNCPTCSSKFVVAGQVDPSNPMANFAAGDEPALDPAEVARRAKLRMRIIYAGVGLVVLILAISMIRRSIARNAVSPIPQLPSVTRAMTQEQSSASAATSPAAAPSVSAAPSRILEGVYKFKNRATNQVLDVVGWSSNADANIKTWTSAAGVNQRFLVRPMSDGYQIVAMHSCKALEIPNGSKDDATPIRQAVATGSEFQIWKLQSVGDGFFQVISKSTGKAIAVLDVTLPKDAPTGQRAPSNVHAQHWKLEALGSAPAEMLPIINGVPLAPAPPSVRVKAISKPYGDKFVAINLGSVMNCDSRTGNFSNPKSVTDTVHPTITGWVDAGGIPFEVVDVEKAPQGKDLLILKGGFQGQSKTSYPKKVEVPVNGARLTKLHILGGVGGWGYPWDRTDKHIGVLAAQVTVIRKGGGQQVLQFRNGIEFADYNARNDVPGSAYVEGFATSPRQARYFNKALSGSEPVEKLIIESFETNIAPVFVAITGETAQ